MLCQNPIAAMIAVPIGAVLPLYYVQRVRRARSAKLLGQLPAAFELMSRVVRAGQTISQALRAVSDEFPPPLAAEFASCYEQQNLGLSLESALRDLARRTGLLEIKIFVLALLVQQQTGGNLAELLDKLSGIIRERFQMHGQIRTLTAEGRAQAAVLLVLPLVNVRPDPVPQSGLCPHSARAPRARHRMPGQRRARCALDPSDRQL